MVLRDQFDAHLVRAAVEQGAELRDGMALSGLEREDGRVRLHAGAERITAQYVVGADGANGVTARLAGFPAMTPPAVAIEVELAVPAAIQDRYAQAMLLDLRCIPGSYGWIFGKGEHLSAGLGVFHGTGRHDLRAALAHFLTTQPDLRAGQVLLQRGHRIPLAGGRRTRRRGPVLLAGDAASLADPLTAEGISYALDSGRAAGTRVLAALAGDDSGLAGYDRYLARDLCGDLRYAWLVAALSYRYPEALIHLAERSPGLLAANTAAVSGTDDYRSLVLLMARKAPKLLRAVLLHGRLESKSAKQPPRL
jgi:flavin-dependent dehydrogenase